MIEAEGGETDLHAWLDDHRDDWPAALRCHGGILFRGFGVDTADDLERSVEVVSGDPLEYKERSSPRSTVSGNIYTSTDYPPNQPIFLHNENSYQSVWPMKIFFACHTPADEGGETPIADCRRVLAAIDPEVRDTFAERGWMYVRNFGFGLGLDWKTVFQTEDPSEVDAYCAGHGIETEWLDGGRLRTRAVRPALARHPESGEELWFNHATFFHVSTLAPEVREVLLAEFDEEDLPSNSYYGDGAPIEEEVVEHLRQAYLDAAVPVEWRQGDLAFLDNMLAAHGRGTYSGTRKILVGMAEPAERSAVEGGVAETRRLEPVAA